MGQEEIVNWLKAKRKESEAYYSSQDIISACKCNCIAVKRALRYLVAYEEIEHKFIINKEKGYNKGYKPLYRGKLEEIKT